MCYYLWIGLISPREILFKIVLLFGLPLFSCSHTSFISLKTGHPLPLFGLKISSFPFLFLLPTFQSYRQRQVFIYYGNICHYHSQCCLSFISMQLKKLVYVFRCFHSFDGSIKLQFPFPRVCIKVILHIYIFVLYKCRIKS